MGYPLKITGTGINLSSTNNEVYNGCAPYPHISFHYVWASVTGSAAAFKLQASNDGTNWDDVSGYTGVTSGASGSGGWQLSGFSPIFYRILVTSASTTGTLTVVVSGNGN